MRYKVFAHLVNMPGTMYIAHNLLSSLIRSRLTDVADIELRLHYGDTEFDKLIKVASRYPNIKTVKVDADHRDYEMPTLIRLHEFCEQNNDTYVLYIHHKGATQPDNPCVSDWRTLLTYHTIDNWKKCVEQLDMGYDTVGINLKKEPRLHYSGNFWWAKSSYINTLPRLVLPHTIGYKSQLGLNLNYYDSFRYDAEMWLCQNNPNTKSMYESNINHYRERHSV